MLARVAANFYWMGRYLERTKQTIRLVRYPLDRLADRTAGEIASGWAGGVPGARPRPFRGRRRMRRRPRRSS